MELYNSQKVREAAGAWTQTFKQLHQYDGITKEAASRGLRVIFDNAVELLYVQSRLNGRKDRMYVAIIIPNPHEARFEIPPAI